MAMAEIEPSPDPEPTERERIDAQCLALFRSGARYSDIAAQLNIAQSRAWRGAQRAREAEPKLNKEAAREDLYHALDRPQMELLRIIGDRDTPQDRKIRAATALVPIIKERADLAGAHQPTVREVHVTTLTPEALDEEKRRLAAELQAAGIDIARLPTADELADIIEARATVATEDQPIEVPWP